MKRKIVSLFILLIFVIGNVALAAGVIWDQMGSKNTVASYNGDYYYVDSNQTPICSNYDNRFKRINDTLFFVNNQGIIYTKDDWGYVRVQKGEIDSMVGQDLTSSSWFNIYGNDKYISYFEKVKDFTAKDNTIYENIPLKGKENDVIVIGDSYTYLFSLHSRNAWPYVCCPGYNVRQIKNELIDRIPDNRYKYCVIFIGGNDLMEQTDPYKFIIDLQELVNEIRDKGMKIIFTSYLDINYDVAPKGYSSIKTKHADYAKIINAVITNNNISYVECRDLLQKYGYYNEMDYIHPYKDFYPELEARIMGVMN